MSDNKTKNQHRYLVTEVTGDCGVEVDDIIRDGWQGRGHEWLIYHLQTMELVGSFKGRHLGRVTAEDGPARGEYDLA